MSLQSHIALYRHAIAATTASALLLAPALASAAPARTGRWAADSDPAARYLLEQERRWAEDSCTPSSVVKDYIAKDFIGTSPSGLLYRRSAMLTPGTAAPGGEKERDCKLLAAKVRFYGPDLAMVYGYESAVLVKPDGSETTRVLIWTDTAVRRKGKWQVIAVQDMVAPPGWKPADWRVPE
ncbi:MAG: nuclear transport factor 2 family protein [Novosphingobium sp.]|uniref:nuclear transport factor 2 family protein n=1 Tax=Novosphingobium sp. TaxID=1874826 RepID=UPI003019C522